MAVSGEPLDSSLSRDLTSKTPFLSLKLYVLIGVLALCSLSFALLVYLCFRLSRTSKKRRALAKNSSGLIPLVSEEIVEIKAVDRADRCDREAEKVESIVVMEVASGSGDGGKKSGESDGVSSGSKSDVAAAEVHANIGWGRWYSLRELEVATCGFAAENVIGEGGYGVVYRGVLDDGAVVAVKSLLNNKYAKVKTCLFRNCSISVAFQ